MLSIFLILFTFLIFFFIVVIISHIEIIGSPCMIMIGYSSLIIVRSIELIIFAQCVTQISGMVGTSQKLNNIIQCFCLLYKYGINSIQLPWSKRRVTNHIWGELFTSTTKCPSNDQRVMSRGYRSVLTRELPTIYIFGFVNIIHHTMHSVCMFFLLLFVLIQIQIYICKSSSRFTNCLAWFVQNVN